MAGTFGKPNGAVLALAGMLLLAGPAAAQKAPTQGEPAGAAANPPAGDPDERVCKTVPVTGSRLGKEKICMTRREWAASIAATQREAGSRQIRGLQGNAVGGNGN